MKFKVNRKWLEACGLNPDSPPFRVISTESDQFANSSVVTWVLLDCGTHQWLVDSRRGKLVDSIDDELLAEAIYEYLA